MEAYKMKIEIGFTILETLNPPFKMSVKKDSKASADANIAAMEAILYKEEDVFVQDCCYLFEALNSDNKPVSKVASIDNFKAAVDFFFLQVLNTDLYLKSIPRASSLCQKELKAFQYV
jgi:hypothetical protein